MHKTIGQLKSLGFIPWVEPRGGMFVWCSLPDGLDAAGLAREALKVGIVLAPGNVFSPSQTAGNLMRFSVSRSLDPRSVPVSRIRCQG
jgi:DNA-binding transcriptional MocR family regulator